MTLAATLCTAAVAERARAAACSCTARPSWATRLHCAALAQPACSSARLVARDVARSSAALRELAPAAVPGVADVRVLGAIGVIELDHPVDIAAATAAAVERGVWLRPFGKLIYAMPPYVTTDEDLGRITEAIARPPREGSSSPGPTPGVGKTVRGRCARATPTPPSSSPRRPATTMTPAR